MYQPSLKIKENGIPIVSNDELDIIGERFIADFSPTALFSPMEIDIDRFVTNYLKLKQDFYYLSHCGVYLGTTVFQTTDYLPVYNPEKKCPEFTHVEAGTVIIDSSLADDSQEHRYRFTMGHESGHSILHPSYYLNSIGVSDEERLHSYVRCRADFNVSTKDLGHYHLSDKQRLEQQANRLASAILMPKCAVKIALSHIPYCGQRNWSLYAANRLSEIFNVSSETAFYRLKELNFIDKQELFYSL